MEFDLSSSVSRLLLIGSRVGALTMSIPALSNILNFRCRIACIGLLSFFLAVPHAQGKLTLTEPMAVLLLQEAILGALLGISVSLLFFVASMSGSLVNQLAGGSLGFQSSPDGSSSPFATLFLLMAVSIFFSIGGHRDLVGALFRSLEQLPPGESWDVSRSMELLVRVLNLCFAFAIRFALPIVLSTILSSVLMAILARFATHFGFFGIGISMNVFVTLIAAMLWLGSIGWAIQHELSRTLNSLGEFVNFLAP